MDIKQLRICHPEPCVRDLKKTRMIEILRFAQNDKVNGFFIILSCWSEATRNLKNRGPVMLERSEASKERKRKRFFRAKASTTRLIASK